MSLRMIPALVWTSLLLIACLSPGRWLHLNESQAYAGLFHFDKLVHGLLFAGFGFFWIQAARSRSRLTWVLVVGVVFAVLTELGQGLSIVSRDPDVLDGLADVVGLLVGLVVGLGGVYVLNVRRMSLEAGPIKKKA